MDPERAVQGQKAELKTKLIKIKTNKMKSPRGISESSTTSDNTTEFIDIVKKFDIVYNNHNPDYKNIDVKMKVWSQIAEEIGLSIDASKRKWKNLRDSYTKYLRSFRVGTKTSKKYQYWAHAEHMDFLKPYQGPGRNSAYKTHDYDDTENYCDLGYQVVTKATTTISEEDLKVVTTSTTTSVAQTAEATMPKMLNSSNVNPITTLSPSTKFAALSTTTTSSNSFLLPVPSLPTVQFKAELLGNPVITSLPALSTSVPAQIFPLPHLSSKTKTPIAMPSISTACSVGCLIIEPHMFATSDALMKEHITSSTVGLVHNDISQCTTTSMSGKVNPPLVTNIRRVQPSPQTAAINLSFSAGSLSTQPPPAKARKLLNHADLDVTSVLQANRDLDANTLFFLSLARSVRSMPKKFQSLAKMRCMRIVSDIELELDSVDCNGLPTEESNNRKYCNDDSTPPPDESIPLRNIAVNDAVPEHFVYVMSPSRLESMIDVSSDEEASFNGN